MSRSCSRIVEVFEPAAADTRRRSRALRRRNGVALFGLVGAWLLTACGRTLDAGSSRPHGLLPVDERNPIILSNDGFEDNWQGEYAVLLANGGGPELAGIIVNTSGPWPDIDANVSGWRSFVAAARQSGLRGVPDPIASISSPLLRPASGNIEDTQPNRSEGALLIVEQSARLSLPYRPIAIVTGGRLTDAADAYLIDPSVADRIVVVSSLGALSASGATMASPNGEMDPWADAIVTSRLRYIQVSSFYDQLTDVPSSRVAQLPPNAFGAWIANKQAKVFDWPPASDQVGVIAVGIPAFAVDIKRVGSSGTIRADASAGPELGSTADGPAWLVDKNASALASSRFWELLLDPSTFDP